MAAAYKFRWEDASKAGQKGFLGAQREASPSISSLDTLWPVVRLHMANESTNGEVFIQPLSSIRHVLESAVMQKRSGEQSGALAGGRGSQMALYSLAIEYIPRLLAYMPRIKTNRPEMGVILLDTLCYLLATEQDSLYSFLVTFSSSLLHLPCDEWPDAHHEIITRLCHFVLPTLLRTYPTRTPHSDTTTHVSLPPLGMSSTLMIVLETCPARLQLLTTDSLMFLKRDVCTDLLSLISHGTPPVCQSALKLLLHYWPVSSDLSRTVSLYGEWLTLECENSGCRRGNVQASTLCLDTACVSGHKSRVGDEAKLYMLLCHECHCMIHRSVADSDTSHPTLQIPQPLRDVKPNCEFQKMCSGKERQVNRAEVTCYDGRCTAIQGGQPIRMCRACHSKQHTDIGDLRHIYQVGPPNPWECNDPESCTAMLEAVSRLLQSQPVLHKLSTAPPAVGRSATHTLLDGLQKIHALPYQLKVEGSREGIWLLSQYCTPSSTVPVDQQEWLVHLSALALEWLRVYHDVLKQVEDEIPSSPSEETDSPSPVVTEYLQYFSNYNDISKLVDPLLITWLGDVARTNSQCLVEALKPNPRPCAQAGKLWDKECDSIQRYQSSLSSLHRLYLSYKSSHIPREAFKRIYDSVMPEWLDLLVQLRTETGKMASLRTHYHRLLSHPHPDGMEMIAFIWDKFRSKTARGADMQRALLWLQDLTRLKIALPYIHHMFEKAVEQKVRRVSDNRAEAKVSVASSFDEEVEERRQSMERERRESTGSNVSETESAILSDSHLHESDTQAIASLNSSLTRSILMLDIWLSQMKLGKHMSNYGMLKRLLVRMLQLPWGSRHSYTDHHDTTTNSCLLCKATALWFSLATQLLEESERRLEKEEEEEGEGYDGGANDDRGRPSRSQQQRISMKHVLKNKLRKLTHGETTTSEDFPPVALSPGGNFGTFPRKKGDDNRRGASPGVVGGRGKSPQRWEELVELTREFSPAEVKSKPRKIPLRKMATVQGEPASLPALHEEAGEEGTEGEESSAIEEDTEEIHTIFNLCRDHLKPKLHPEAIHRVVQCLMVLVRRSRVLHGMEALEEAQQLFRDAWKCLGGQSSYVDRSCVGLLIDCLKFLNEQELSGSVEMSTGWTTFYYGLKNDKFKTVEKFCIFLEFMLSPETELVWKEDSSAVRAMQVTVAHSFCLAVQLLQDKTSSVASRAQYCLGNLSIATLKALRKFVMRLFLDRPSYRTLTLHSLSLLNTALPRLGLLTLDLLENIMSSLSSSPHSISLASSRFGGDHASKKGSVASVTDVGAHTPKTSISSGLPSSPMAPANGAAEESELLQLALALLLKYLANSESDAEECLRRARLERGTRESSVELEVKAVVLFRLSGLIHDPPSLRTNPVFHVFLNHVYPVLDNSTEFSSVSVLSFVLNLLITSTAPTGEEGFLQCLDHRGGGGGREGRRCEFGLGVLPPALRVPWLQVFFIILYKYIHTYQSMTLDTHVDLVFLARCCMEIALNTIEATPHTCPLLATNSPSSVHAAQLKKNRPKPPDSYPGGSASQPTPAATSLSQQDSPLTPLRPGRERSPHREGSPSTPQQSIPISSAHKLVTATLSTGSMDSVGSISSVFLRSGFSIPKPHSGLCSVCGRVTNDFSEDVITHCAIAVATCCHRLPKRVSGYLVSHVIPALAKVISTEPPSFTWQSSSDEQPPGSAVAVASNLLKSVATQFADRHLFLFLFSHDGYGAARGPAERVFTALGSSLPPPSPPGEGEGDGSEEESEEMTVMSPVTYFLQDAVNSPNFTQDVRSSSLTHLALYVEKNPLSVSGMFRNLNLLDSFLKKLRNTSLLHDAKAVYAFMRFIIQVLVSAPDNVLHTSLRSPPVNSFSQSLTSCVEVAFSHVSCPVVGLFQLACLWYKTFLPSPRDANRLVLLYISELRKALKGSQTNDIMHFGTFVNLTQVLLLEENGYLSYVEGLSEERVFAPQLKEQFEFGDIFLNAIQEMQWDFVDAILFLDSSPNRLPAQYVQELPHLKLLVGQLVALRIQHGRSPVDHLRRVINRDLRPISLPSKGAHQRLVAVRWYDHLSALHIMSWLLLGAMSHNAVHQVTTALGGGRCQLLGSLDANVEVITNNVVWLTRGAMQGIRRTSDNSGSHCQYLLFAFTAIWTYYMETWEPNCTADIVQFWENFVSNMVDMLGDYNITDERHRMNVLNNVNDLIIIPLKKCGLSCFTMLIPIWRKLSNQLIAGQFQVFPNIPETVTTVTVDVWFKEMVSELVTVERESSPHIATTAL